MAKIVVETVNSEKRTQIQLKKCLFLKIINVGGTSVWISFGSGEIEILSSGFQDFYINTGTPITQTMYLRYAGTPNLQITRIEEE